MGNIGYVLAGRPPQTNAEVTALSVSEQSADSIAQVERPTVISNVDRILSSVDDLLQNRNPDGTYSPQVLADNLQNITSEIQERGMRYAVTKSRHEAAFIESYDGTRQRTFMWLGKTALEVAMDGVLFHKHPAALKRVEVEVNEAQDIAATLRAGHAKVLISPRMTEKDAPLEAAQQEHLANDDAIRVTFPVTDTQNEVVARDLFSLLVADVPREAWLALLNDPDNIFGRSMQVPDDGSALPIMQAHRQLELPAEKLPEGPITILAAVVPYITDPKLQARVAAHVVKFRQVNQSDFATYAHNLGIRQQAFDIEVAESLKRKVATPYIEQHILALKNQWSDESSALIRAAIQFDGSLRMNRDIAALVSDTYQTFITGRAQVLTEDAELQAQMSIREITRLREEELSIQRAQRAGYDLVVLRAQEAAGNSSMARRGVQLGDRGCSGGVGNSLRRKGSKKGSDTDSDLDDFELWEEELAASDGRESYDGNFDIDGVCRIEVCVSRSIGDGVTKVGECNVCRGCQKMYDIGIDRSKMWYIVRTPRKKELQNV
ncbi:MAG TPA: hypothetical protein VLG16_01340 [Candidatus Saccharimonadales bacterium]|nr:hypothetical protein [Candidatus Saccharimonadales bacterium]